MKSSELHSPKLSFSKDPSPETSIKCINNSPAIHVCSNPDCNKYAFVCSSPQCQCNQEHQLCSLIVIRNLTHILKKKIISLQPLEEMIISEFDKLIDKTSEIRDSLIAQCQKSLSIHFGLQTYQSQFLFAFEKHQVKHIRGKDVCKVQQTLKSPTKPAQNFESVELKIKNSIKKLNQDLLEAQKQIQRKIDILKDKNASLFDSYLIKTAQQQSIIEQFFPNKTIKSAKLLYRASQNKFLVSKFHEKCSGKANAFIICETEFGKVLGAYTPMAWNTSGTWAVDHSKQSFLFSLTKNVKFSQVNTINTMFLYEGYGPYLGGSPDLYIIDRADIKESSAFFSSSFTNVNYPGNTERTNLQILGSTHYSFKVKEWEVFQLDFC